jgi:hypothetical protein
MAALAAQLRAETTKSCELPKGSRKLQTERMVDADGGRALSLLTRE